ncbi:hypothetical protein R6Q59_002651 [Mikania micrantha]
MASSSSMEIGDDMHFMGSEDSDLIQLFQLLPLIEHLEMNSCPVKCFSSSVIPQSLPNVLLHLRDLVLYGLSIGKEDELRFVLLLVTSSPNLKKLKMETTYYNEKLTVRRTPNNFLDLENYPDLKLDHLETLEIKMFSNSPLVMDFVKLVMAKSPVLKKVRIQLRGGVSVDDELKMLRGLILLPFRRASPYAKLVVERYN